MEGNPICYFAETDARNQRVKFGIKAVDRSRHMYVIGKTGMGKSTLLENMAIQDMQRGDGIAFIDPHGKTAELLLDYVPEHRIKDVLYFAPFDLDFPISFNVMEDVGPDKRHLVVSGLMSAFKKIWIDAWSARMEYILNNILLALLEYPGSTILGVNRMLADKEYRKKVVDNVKDVSVKAFWVDEFSKYGDRYMQEAGAAIQNKVGQFISNPLIRNIIGQPESSFDLRAMMDQRKIVIVNLSKGRVGEQNANLLGSMFVTKLYLAAMSRADMTEAAQARAPYFYLYVDEFQSFANESFASILSEARKYHLALTIAHQYIEQMSEEVRAAVFGNVGTMVVFRVGAYDAEVLEKEYAPRFTAEDIVNLGFAQIYLKLMIDGVTSPPFSAVTLPPVERPPSSYRDDIIEWTRRAYAHARPDVEETIKKWSESERQPDPVPRDDAKRKAHSSQGDTSRHSHVRERPRPPLVEREEKMPQRETPPLGSDSGFVSLKDLGVGLAPQSPISHTPHRSERQGQKKDVRHTPPAVPQRNTAAGGAKDQKSPLRDALAAVLKKTDDSSHVKAHHAQPDTRNVARESVPAHSKGGDTEHASKSDREERHKEKVKSENDNRGTLTPDDVRKILHIPDTHEE